MDERKTSEEWINEFPDIIIHDPDGWNRSNLQYSWYEEKITRSQFCQRLVFSTCEYAGSKSALDIIREA